MAVQHSVWLGAIAAALEGGLAALLNQNPDKTRLLAPLAGSTIAVEVEPFGASVHLCVTAHDIKWVADSSVPADVTLSGRLAAFAALGLNRESRLDPASHGLHLSGDPDRLEAIRELLANLDLALMPPLPVAPHAGVAKPQTVSVPDWLASSMAHGLRIAETLKLNLAEYWQEESRELPTASEVQAFCQAVNDLEQTVRHFEQGFEQRIARLKR